MSLDVNENLMKDGDQVILQREKVLKLFQIRKQRLVWFERTKFHLNNLIGQPWGTTFNVQQNQLKKVSQAELIQDDDAEMLEGRDNRNIVDGNNQKLTRDEILAMKKDGASGQDIVENLIENSSTFKQKTEFSQQKYIKKKKKKHTCMLTAVKPNSRLLIQMYFNRGPSKVNNMRIDSVAQILTQANVHAGCKLMVVETCVGLLLGAVLERMGGIGTVVQFYNGTAPARQALAAYNFSDAHLEGLQSYPLDKINLLKGSTPETPRIESNDSNVFQPESNNDNSLNKDTSCESGIVPLPDTAQVSIDMEQCPSISGADSVDSSSRVEMNTNDSISKLSAKTSGDDERAESVNVEEALMPSSLGKANDGEVNERQKQLEAEREVRRQAKLKQLKNTGDIIKQGEMDGLIVSTKFHPTPIVMSLIDFVLPSRPVVVFCQYKEPLLDLYMHLRNHAGLVNLKLTETWHREYQVLPNRSHPVINMSGNGGYLLTGTTVLNE